MKLIDNLSEIWRGVSYPFLIHKDEELHFSDIAKQALINLEVIRKGDVVAIIGDFNPSSILTFLRLIDIQVIVVPLTIETRNEHEYFFESALVDV
ncbi:MAG: hypothetical protein ACKVOY_03715, partial [Burkholderiaceae bacterium]